jgi:hypothetical protein
VPNENRAERIKEMAGNTQTVKGRKVVTDFLELGANAFVGGVMVAIALAMITLALATTAQAAPLEKPATLKKTACLEVVTPQEPRSVALMPADEDTAGVGALWANLLMGSVALSSAGIVAYLGRAIPARRPERHPQA